MTIYFYALETKQKRKKGFREYAVRARHRVQPSQQFSNVCDWIVGSLSVSRHQQQQQQQQQKPQPRFA